MTTSLRVALMFGLLLGCSGARDVDAGLGLDAASLDARVASCERNQDCAGTFCMPMRCMPGASGADARGCLAAPGPCDAEERCDLAAESCEPIDCAEPDADGDGHVALRCGGDDCDDANPSIHAGATERCDEAAVDEDCDPTTMASSEGDGDDDEYVSDICCNGTSCGVDCDDSDPAVSPLGVERCDGRDDDCDGTVDEERAVPLCPGGTCRAGRCDLTPWDRTFGSIAADAVLDVAMDADGAVYVFGVVGGDSDFGEGSVRPLGGRAYFVVKYRPTGVRDWVYTSPTGLSSCYSYPFQSIAVASDRSVYIVGLGCGIDFGSGTSENSFVVRLDAGGAQTHDLRFSASCAQPDCFVGLYDVAATEGRLVLTGAMWGQYDFGDGEVDGGSFSGFLLELDRSLGFRRVQVRRPPEGWTWLQRIDASADGSLVVGGLYNGGFAFDAAAPSVPVHGDPAAVDPADHTNAFVVRLNEDLSPRWSSVIGQGASGETGFGSLNDVAISDDGAVAFGGVFSGIMGFDGVERTATGSDGYVVRLGADGDFSWSRLYDGARPRALAVTSSGHVTFAGEFDAPTNFGAGIASLPSTTTSAAFLVRLEPSGAWAAESIFGLEGDNRISGLAVGPADATALAGSFTGSVTLGGATRGAVGDADVFVYRPAE